MTRYRKSIHQTLQEVAEWEAPKEPEVIVEEAPIPTETGRELLKKRIAHRKIEKKEIKYYPMGDVFKGKLHKTTQYLKEALELDELDEAVKWEVKVSGLPVFYSDGKSKGAVRQMLRKLLKHPDDIISITRTTSAELKKIRRGQIAGDEPGDEDEDKNPVGPSYNESATQAQIDAWIAKGNKIKKIPSKPQPSHQTARARSDDARYHQPTGSRAVGAGKQWGAYKRATDKRRKAAQKEEVTEELPPHLSKFVDKKGDLKPDAAKRVAAGRKKDKPKYKIKDVTPKGYGPNEEDEMAIMSLDHKELPRKLKITQKGLEAFKQSREDVELDEAGRPRGAAHIENTRFWDLKDKELHYIIKDAGQAVQANPTSKKATQGPGNWSDQINDAATVLYYRKKKKIKVEAFEGPFSAPGSGSIARPRKAKATDLEKSIEDQMADARRENLAFQENEWDQMWKNAAKSRPKMSFKQAIDFVDEVDLPQKDKKNALKKAKKWLR